MEEYKCSKCKVVKPISEFYFRKDSNSYRKDCKSCKDKSNIDNKLLNPQKYKDVCRNHFKKNKDTIVLKRRIRRGSNELIMLRHNIRSSISTNFRKNGIIKSKTTEKILGCTITFFKKYIEDLFEPWMSWELYGIYNGKEKEGFDLDHIIPIASAKTEEDIYKLNHYTNFQPLCSFTNRYIKKDNII